VLASALVNRPTWHEARFTLAALQAERDERRQALTTLLEGAALDPGRFALTAAQLQAELNDPVGALRTLEQVPQAARDEEFHALVAAIAQRAGRHELAVTEYGTVLKSAPARAVAWVGLGVSLQALGREAQAWPPTAARPRARSVSSCVASSMCASRPCNRPQRRRCRPRRASNRARQALSARRFTRACGQVNVQFGDRHRAANK